MAEGWVLPQAVEQLIQQICREQNQTPPGTDVRQELALLGEEKAVNLLRKIAVSTIKKTLSAFIMYMIRIAKQPHTHTHTHSDNNDATSPQKVPRVSLLHSPSSPSPSAGWVLPQAVEQLIQQICREQNQTPPGTDVRQELALLGEEKAVNLLRKIAVSTIKKTLSAFIMYMIRIAKQPHTHTHTHSDNNDTTSPQKVPRVSLLHSPSSPSPSAPASQSQSQSRHVYSPTQGRRVTQSTIPELWSQASLTSPNEYQVATLNMELAATPRFILQNPLLKPRVRVSPRPLFLTLTPNSISTVHHRQQQRMNMSKPISCAASAEDNGSTTTTTATATASPIGAVARIGEVKRVTKETNVSVKINLDGTGVAENNTGIPFLDHMLDQLASHGLFDVHVKATGDIHIDDHHTNEDVALAIGTACLQALGDRKGINRFGDFSAPLDEALIHVALDLSGRPYLGYDLQIPTQRVGTYDTQLVEHFFQSLVNTSGMTLHIRQLAGRNSHHIIEATFKAFARALRQATEYDPRRSGTVPSSKGVLSRS